MRKTESVSLLIVLSAAELFCGTIFASPLNGNTPQTNQFPLHIKGTIIGNVSSTFVINGLSPATARIHGVVELTNALDKPSEFYSFSFFVRHMKILDSNGDKLEFSARSGLLDPFVSVTSLPAHGGTRLPFDIPLKEFFDLKAGRYEVWFVYDERLLRHPFTVTDIERPRLWSDLSIKFILRDQPVER